MLESTPLPPLPELPMPPTPLPTPLEGAIVDVVEESAPQLISAWVTDTSLRTSPRPELSNENSETIRMWTYNLKDLQLMIDYEENRYRSHRFFSIGTVIYYHSPKSHNYRKYANKST